MSPPCGFSSKNATARLRLRLQHNFFLRIYAFDKHRNNAPIEFFFVRGVALPLRGREMPHDEANHQITKFVVFFERVVNKKALVLGRSAVKIELVLGEIMPKKREYQLILRF